MKSDESSYSTCFYCESNSNERLQYRSILYGGLYLEPVGEELISSIGKGLCILVGICQSDSIKDVDFMVRKILALRLFEDVSGKRWAKSVKDKDFEILCVSQFTLYHKLKGNKPDFHQAMQGSNASALYNTFLEKLGQNYAPEKIKDGKFGAYMQVLIQNDGPVTIELESPQNQNEKNNGTTMKTVGDE